MQDHKLIAFSDAGQKKIQERIENLRIDLGASGALLSDESGQLLVECGRLRGLDINAFLALLGNAMSATNAVVHLLRDEAAFDLHFHEGQSYEMYTTRLNDQVFLTLILERGLGGTSRIGMVWLTLRRAVTELRSLVGKSMVQPGTAESREIKSAIGDMLDEAMNLFDSNVMMGKVPSATPPPATTPEEQPAPRPRPKLPGRGTPQQPPPPIVEPPKRHAPQMPTEPPKKEPPPAPAEPPKKPAPPAESAPGLNPEILNDPRHQLTYEEARALGLINLDNLEAD